MRELVLMLGLGIAGGWSFMNTASEVTADRFTATRTEVAVPQTLLSLVHAPEIHRELRLSDDQIAELEQLFESIDGTWWRSRNLPGNEQRPIIEELESRVRRIVEDRWSPEAARRLKQLEMQSQSVRMLHRSEMAAELSLTVDQQRTLVALAEATDLAETEWYAAVRQGRPAEQLGERFQQAKEREKTQGMKLLTRSQAERLAELVGQPFDFSGLTRIYPLAPELLVTDGWVGNAPGTLRELRGKVVVVHFYAFQCINCQRNLPIYNEWAQHFAGRDVVLIGIQTPETQAERDVQQIAAAARENKQEYPVLVDLQNRNWDAWGNTMWPTVYLIDRRGYIRFWWQGELNWQGAQGDKAVADMIERLLDE